jgi:hypothetical protein
MAFHVNQRVELAPGSTFGLAALVQGRPLAPLCADPGQKYRARGRQMA